MGETGIVDCNSLLPLDVSLLGDRPYVQGTQMIVQCAGHCDLESPLFRSAKFARITDRIVATSCSVLSHHGFESVGRVIFRSASGEQRLFDLVAMPERAPRRSDDFPPELALLSTDGQLNAEYSFSSRGDFSGILNLITQAVKRLHLELSDNVYDVWLTGLRDFTLPVSGLGDRIKGRLLVTCSRVMISKSAHQSSLEISLQTDPDAARHTGLVTFAYKLGSE
jgi:hypothetical protein